MVYYPPFNTIDGKGEGMSTGFTATEWKKINQRFDAAWPDHGVPEGGREASLVFSSFNIRKLGGIRVGKKKLNRRPYIDFMARYCARCDLIAIQEVQDNLDALIELKARMEDHIAEPGAVIGFAGRRVIEGTIREKLPDDFQTSEYLLEHGMIDMIVSRLEMKDTISRIVRLMLHLPPIKQDIVELGSGIPGDEDVLPVESAVEQSPENNPA